MLCFEQTFWYMGNGIRLDTKFTVIVSIYIEVLTAYKQDWYQLYRLVVAEQKYCAYL